MDTFLPTHPAHRVCPSFGVATFPRLAKRGMCECGRYEGGYTSGIHRGGPCREMQSDEIASLTEKCTVVACTLSPQRTSLTGRARSLPTSTRCRLSFPRAWHCRYQVVLPNGGEIAGKRGLQERRVDLVNRAWAQAKNHKSLRLRCANMSAVSPCSETYS